MNYTKGPWTIQKLEGRHNGYEGWETFAIRSPQNVCLAVVGDVDHYHEPDHAGNASLISAAPDMYEALKMVIASVPFAAYRGDGELEEVERVVLVALNKAEGRE